MQEGRSAFDAIAYALRSHTAEAACQAAAPAGNGPDGIIVGAAAAPAEQALSVLQAGLADERRQWEEELTDGGTLLRLADNGLAALDDAGRALV